MEALRTQIQRLRNDEVMLEEHTAQLQGILKQMADDEECKRWDALMFIVDCIDWHI